MISVKYFSKNVHYFVLKTSILPLINHCYKFINTISMTTVFVLLAFEVLLVVFVTILLIRKNH